MPRKKLSPYTRLAMQYRPKKHQALEKVTIVLVRRQEYLNQLAVKRGFRDRRVTVTIPGLMAAANLTEKQVRDALKTLRDAKLIVFRDRHNGRRGLGSSIYNCQPLVWEIRKPPPDYQRLMAEADHRAYLEDRAQEVVESTAGWGKPSYDEELRREVEESIREARADALATQVWLREELEDFAARAMEQYEIWNLPGYLSWLEAGELAEQDGQADDEDGISEEQAEAIALDRREWLAYLYHDGAVHAVIGIPGWAELLAQHFPERFRQLFGDPGTTGTPEAA